MENRNLEYIILYLIVGCVIIVFAAIVRLFTLVLGFDNFSASVVFFVSIGSCVVIYLSINLFLQRLMLPWIAKILQMIPYIKNRTEKTGAIAREKVFGKEAPKIQQPLPNLDQLRKEHFQAEEKEQKNIRSIALQYTQSIFAPYTTDEELKRLCHYIELYSLKKDFSEITPIKLSDNLNSIDLYHFGWNIWNHFRISKQTEVAYFLKKVFPDILHDVEIETIKRHLKDDELKGIIKIQKSLSVQE